MSAAAPWVPGAAVLLTALVAAGQQAPAGLPMSQAALRRQAQPVGAPPIEVLNVEKGWGGSGDLLPLLRSEDPQIANAAAAAVGRLEDPRLVPTLLTTPSLSNGARANAIAQSLKGFDPSNGPDLVAAALEWLQAVGSKPLSSDPVALGEIAPVMLPLGRIRYATPEQMHKAEEVILRIAVFARPDPRLGRVYVTGLQALESLARVNTRVSGLEPETIAQLDKAVEKQSLNDSPAARFFALAALINGRGLSRDSARVAAGDEEWQVRRLAMTVLAGGGGGLDPGARLALIREGLEDKSAQVRYEALRGYVRHGVSDGGCGPIKAMLLDADLHVAIAAIDALGGACKDDEDVTTSLLAEARTPPAIGSWHRETHAFVALAKRAPDKAATSMEAFVTHPVWWVRMYAAGAAAAAGDLIHLDKLAYDANDNVREAAIEPLRRLKKFEADRAIVAALDRADVQLLRTAARLLEESPRSSTLVRPLMSALMRLTREGKETSRDTRLALLDAIAVHVSRDEATELLPLLRDFDPRVAERAAQIVIAWTGRVALPSPVPRPRGWPQEFSNLRQCVVVQLASGSSFRMRMQPASAPIAVDRFLKLATKDKYYDGLTIHRVVPNFVIQGGSPGANEYAGHKDYMRDEVGGNNSRGSVGLSTRGRNTGDAQFFVNLVDNPRLNYDYTVFATVLDMDVVDRIQEGEVMRSINLSKCPGSG